MQMIVSLVPRRRRSRGPERKSNPLTPLSGFRCSQSGEWEWVKKEEWGGGFGVEGLGGGGGEVPPPRLKSTRRIRLPAK